MSSLVFEIILDRDLDQSNQNQNDDINPVSSNDSTPNYQEINTPQPEITIMKKKDESPLINDLNDRETFNAKLKKVASATKSMTIDRLSKVLELDEEVVWKRFINDSLDVKFIIDDLKTIFQK